MEGVTGTSSKRGPISVVFPSVFVISDRSMVTFPAFVANNSQGKTSPWGVKMPGMPRKALDAPVW